MKESKIREILISYQKKRDKAESDLELRKNDVYSQIPEFKKLDDEISKVGLQLAKLVLQNPSNRENIILESKKKMDELKSQKKELLTKYKVPNGYLEIQHDCNVCKDKGFLDNGHKCNCLKQEIINRKLNVKISVDGGINEEVLTYVKEADILVSSSFILSDLDKNVDMLKNS